MSSANKAIQIIQLGRPYGIKGMVRATLYTSNLKKYKTFYDHLGNLLKLKIVRYLESERVVLSIDGINDRDSASALNGKGVYIRESDLPSLEPDEFYIDDLIGKIVFVSDDDREYIISDISNYGAGDLIELSGYGKKFLVPFTSECFPEISKEKGIIVTKEAIAAYEN